MGKEKWLLCPVCGNKTRLRLRVDTVLINFPLYCPKCRQETLITVVFPLSTLEGAYQITNFKPPFSFEK
jgi:hypothetical protein